MYSNPFACIYEHVHLCTYICMYVRTYIHTYIRTYIHMYVAIIICMLQKLPILASIFLSGKVAGVGDSMEDFEPLSGETLFLFVFSFFLLFDDSFILT